MCSSPDADPATVDIDIENPANPAAAGQRVLPARHLLVLTGPAALQGRGWDWRDPKLAPGSRSHASPGRGLPRPPRTRPRPSCGGRPAGRPAGPPWPTNRTKAAWTSSTAVPSSPRPRSRPRRPGRRTRTARRGSGPPRSRAPARRTSTSTSVGGPGPRAAESDRTSLNMDAVRPRPRISPGLGAVVGGPPGGDARLVETGAGAIARPTAPSSMVRARVAARLPASPAVNPSSRGTSRGAPRAITA